jgi:methionyl-tRNA formyltransferase
MNLVFFGTPSFAAKILSSLIQKKISISAVVTQADSSHYGRTLIPPVKLVALESLPGVPIFQPEKASDPAFLQELKAIEADFFVVVAYGQILKQTLLDLPKKAALNVHASLLPKYRGAAPMQRCLMNGDKETGITIMKMVLQMDAGDLIASSKVWISQEMTLGELEEVLCRKSQELLPEVLLHYERYPSSLQNPDLVTFAPKISQEECAIDWKQSAESLHNRIRAVSPHPGAYTWCWIGKEKKRLKIFRSKVCSEEGASQEILLFEKGRLVIGCGSKSISLEEVQLEGKRKMSIEEFYCGHHANFSLVSDL